MCLDILKSLRGTFECKVLYGEPEKFVVLEQQAVEHRHWGAELVTGLGLAPCYKLSSPVSMPHLLS